ncbi:MAG: hypothetical protein ACR2ML_14545 [Solirubrobacteraceae bacterium]
MQVVIRRQVERLFPGLPWHQGVAVLTTVWLVLVAAMAVALADLSDEPALAARQVVVQMPAPGPAPGKGGSGPPPPGATPSEPAGGSDPAPDAAGTDGAAPVDASPVDVAPGEAPFPSAPAPQTLPPLEPEPTNPGDTGDQPEATTWKSGAEAYTLALEHFATEAEAGGAVDAALAAGVKAGSTASDAFASLRDGLFVVFSGYHATLSEARKEAKDLATRGYTKAQPVYFSEKRARRCEDEEQPRPAVPEDAKKAPTAGGKGGAAPRAAGRDGAAGSMSGVSPRAAGEDTATTDGDSDTPTTGGAGDQGGGMNEPLPVIELPCEIRPADVAPGKGGSGDDTGGGPTVKP